MSLYSLSSHLLGVERPWHTSCTRARAYYIAEKRAKHHETAGSGVLYDIDYPALFSLFPLAPDNVPPTAYNRRMEIDVAASRLEAASETSCC